MTHTFDEASAAAQVACSVATDAGAATSVAGGTGGRYALSEGQKGIWALQKAYPAMTAYNVPLCFRLRDLCEPAFRDACEWLLGRYPILSAAIREEDGAPWRVQPPGQRLAFNVLDVAVALRPGASDAEIREYLYRHTRQRFALESGPLFRVLVLRAGAEATVALTVHHIVFDGESLAIIMTALMGAYRALLRGEQPERAAAADSYQEFVEAEQSLLRSPEGQLRLDYWKRQLGSAAPDLLLPTDRPRTSATAFPVGRSHARRLDARLAERCSAFAREHGISLAALFLGVLDIVLSRYTGETDIIIGMPVSVRGHARFAGVVGFFVNMVPTRVQLAGDEPVGAFLKRLQRVMVDGMAMQYPFRSLVHELGLGGRGEFSPVFRVAYMYQSFHSGLERDADLVTPIEDVRQEGEYELTLEVLERPSPAGARELSLAWKYNPELYDEATLARMMSQYVALLDDVLCDGHKQLEACSLLSDEERRTLLVHWNDTRVAYPNHLCVHELIDARADETPSAPALSSARRTLSYAELRQETSSLAARLQRHEVKANELVAIYVERGAEMVVGLLGILKAGGAYVPLDPDYPEERLVAILRGAGARLILTMEASRSRVAALASRAAAGEGSEPLVISLDDSGGVGPRPALDPALQAGPADLAYVIYTSGSTGIPKGVMIPHRALTNFLVSMAQRPGIEAADTLLALTTYCFDIAALELYLPLTRGARCHVADAGAAKDADSLKRLIAEVRPSIMQSTPATWQMLFHSGWRNEERVRILCGGEALPEALRAEFARSGSRAWNLFGPTETTVWSTVDEVDAHGAITIGRPIANTRVYILDARGQLAPIGVPGELCIAGDGVAAGYLNQPRETQAKFVEDPFSDQVQARMCRTGDRARWRADGRIEFLGRFDFQVKIRGFRVELQEIEHLLDRHRAIETSAVVTRKQGGTDQLIAYYVVRQTPRADVPADPPRAAGAQRAAEDLTEELHAHLATKLPDYMLPSLFVPLEAMPLTPSGKVDRRALAERQVRLRGSRQAGPADASEAAAAAAALPSGRETRAGSTAEPRVLEIWREVLGVDDLEVTDGFFDAGGNSVSAVMLAERLSSAFGVSFNASTLFKHSNVRECARYLEQRVRKALPEPTAAATMPPPLAARAQPAAGGHVPPYYADSLAIIGISCEFPGAPDVSTFWANLREGKESARFHSKAELRAKKVPEALLDDPDYVPMCLAITGKDQFDRSFFNLTAKDVELMDPQFRLLLVHAWQAVEDAGYACKDIPDTAVYMSASNSYYQALLRASGGVASSDEYQAWLFAQGGTIPTRVSYELGFRGPSLFIHTNCSSGLVSLSVAANSLRAGESKYALVGASTVFPVSRVGYVHQPGLNLSSDGHCRAFDAAADGLTTGEGVAVLLVRPALDAVRDGDHIYALVRGVAINNDGASKAGFYAPGQRAQAAVIRRALQSTGVHPETIDYVEAHGTGTKLGDPAEVSALTDAFREFTSEKGFCALGSVKPNIGHLDTVAGLSGCIKVALSLKHGEIPPSINFRTPNPEIDFAASPFYVAGRLLPWPSSSATTGQGVRRAAVSSFGIGGTNAHAILEAYSATPSLRWVAQPAPPRPMPGMVPAEAERVIEEEHLVLLSAKSPERRRAYAEKLLAYLVRNIEAPPDIRALAFTLQVGREPMDSRVAFIVRDTPDLIAALRRYLEGKSRPDECFSGAREKGNGLLALVDGDDELRGVLAGWLRARKLSKLAAVWVLGLDVEWQLLHEQRPQRRISLPTYPFAPEPCGASLELGSHAASERVGAEAALAHPLLQRAETSVEPRRFYSTLHGQEFFLRDHVVQGRRMLPGVAYLEMARAAAEVAIGRVVAALRDVVWMKPVVVDAERELIIALSAEADEEANGTLSFEVASHRSQAHEAEIHSQGRIDFQAPGAGARGPRAPSRVDVEQLRQSCVRSIEGSRFYAYLARGGGNYGPRFKSIKDLWKNDREVLARLELPEPDARENGAFGLHPSIMDAAFQIWDSLILQPRASGACLPFFVKRVDVYRPTPRSGYALVRASSAAGEGSVVKGEIQILDDDGQVCVAFHEFTARPEVSSAELLETEYHTEVWQHRAAHRAAGVHGRAALVCVAASRRVTDELRNVVVSCAIEGLPQVGAEPLPLERSVEQALSRAASHGDDSTRREVLLLLPDELDVRAQAALVRGLPPGAAASARFVFVAGLEQMPSARVAEIIERETTADAAQIEVRYDSAGRRLAPQLVSLEVERWLLETGGLRPDGTYWVSGAASALGSSIAHHLSELPGASIILADVAAARPRLEAARQQLERAGVRLEVLVADTEQLDQLSAAVRGLRERHGAITGVFHCIASSEGSLHDGGAGTLAAAARAALAIANVDAATRSDELDFFFVVSGTQPGQRPASEHARSPLASHVARFVKHRNALVGSGQRRGKTRGIHCAGALLEPDLARSGAASREAFAVLQAVHHALAEADEQVFVAWRRRADPRPESSERPGVEARGAAESSQVPVRSNADPAAEAPASAPRRSVEPGATGAPQADLEARVRGLIRRCVADVIKADPDELEDDEEFGRYGFDSLSLTTLSNRINQAYALRADPRGGLNPTIFFERPTIRGLAEHLAAAYEGRFRRWLAHASGEPSSFAPAPTKPHPPSPSREHTEPATRAAPSSVSPGERSPAFAFDVSNERPSALELPGPSSGLLRAPSAASSADDVAIVGISCEFPGARDVGDFWRNLVEGRNCIREVPSDRWDWREYYGDPAKEPNKTDVKWGGFIDGMASFDPLFFNISPREAYQMDPSHRLLMTHVWLAIEDAGYNPLDLAGSKTGIFAGIAQSAYGELRRRAGGGGEGNSFLGVVPSIGVNRISHFLDLHGPSEPIETACSSSLVAIHRAVTSMRNGDCDMALAGGVQTILTPHAHIGFSRAGMLARDGRCKTFSKGADGFVRGEGVGCLFLKRLRAAEADGDPIYAVIRSSAVNHDGRSSTLTSPNARAQRDVIVAAYERAGVHPSSVGYIEAHGTGTSLGDPIEINALQEAFGHLDRKLESGLRHGAAVPGASWALGTVKTNIGHLEMAAGVAGVIKVLLQLQHAQLVRSLHFEELNPYIALQGTPFYVVERNQEWPSCTDERGAMLPRRSGVSSFGIGGVNAHVVLEEYTPDAGVRGLRPAMQPACGAPVAVVLSARNSERLLEYIGRLLAFVRNAKGRHPELRLIDLAYTLQLGREAMEERLGLVVTSISELEEKLGAVAAGVPEVAGTYRGRVKRTKKQATPAEPAAEELGLVPIWLAKRKFEAVLPRWVTGMPVDWSLLYRATATGGDGPRRIHVPGYPFARDRFWLTPELSVPTPSAAEAGAGAPGEPSANAAHAAPEPTSAVVQSTPVAGQSATSPRAEAPRPTDRQFSTSGVGLLARAPVWDPDERRSPPTEIHPRHDSNLVVLGGSAAEQLAIRAIYPRSALSCEWRTGRGEGVAEALSRHLQQSSSVDHLVWIADAPADGLASGASGPREVSAAIEGSSAAAGELDRRALSAARERGGSELARSIRSVLRAGYGSRDLSWTVITRQADAVSRSDALAPGHASIYGLVGSMAREYPHWSIRLLDMPADRDWPLEALFSQPYSEQGDARAYRDGVWYRRTLLPVHELPCSHSAYKQGGVYLVIGGAGGIGFVWSQWLVEKHQAQVIWVGRRPEDEEVRAKVRQISRSGRAPVYMQADARDRDALLAVRRRIEEMAWEGRPLKLSGVVLSSLVLADASLATMDDERFESALRAKTDVAVNVADVFGSDALDFMLFFSSAIAFRKTAGQSNYAAGCTFSDAFARWLARRVSYRVKVVNWGYWGGVGVVSDPIYRERMRAAGIGSIEPEEGMAALEAFLASGFEQLAVVKVIGTDAAEADDAKEVLSSLPGAPPARATLSPTAVEPIEARLAEQAAEARRTAAGESARRLERLMLRVLARAVTPYLRSRQGLDRRYERWLDETIALLVATGQMERHSDGGLVLSPSSNGDTGEDDLWNDWRSEATRRGDGEATAPMRLAEVCARALPRVLDGSVLATDVLFPNSSLELVEGLYKGNRVSDLFNRAVELTLLGHVEARAGGRGSSALQIIEIGAGTGGTAAGLLQVLEPYREHIVEYCFTDLSHTFLLHAREVYGTRYPFLKTRLFNVEKPAAAQGVPVGRYDFAIAANVLHATRDIRQTLRNAKAALRPGGVLILNEISQKSLFTHLTFGLLDGWWRYDDAPLRIPGSPGLYPEIWARLLEEEGFDSVDFAVPGFHSLGQQIISARSDGLVRQPPAARSAPLVSATRVVGAARAVTEAAAPHGPSLREEEVPAPEPGQHRPLPRAARPARDIELPRTDLEKTLAGLWSRLLGLEPIGVNEDFFELGGQSLLATELMGQIATATGRRLPFRVMFEAPTIAELAMRIEASASELALTPAADEAFASDIRLDEDIVVTHPPALSRPPEVALVTGATGFLGAFVVDALLSRTRSRLICLVRADNERAGRARLHAALATYRIPAAEVDARVEIVCADLAGGRYLGLAEREYHALAERVDEIFHLGARVNFAHPYRALREVNVAAVQNLLRFAAARRVKPLHLASTIAIFATPRYAAQTVVEEDDSAAHGAELQGGYPQSKWVADRIAALAMQRGVPVTIHRPGSVGGHSVTGAYNRSDYLLNMLLASADAGYAPEADFELYFAPVDDVAAAMVSLAHRPESLGKAFHLICPPGNRMTTVWELLERLGYPTRRVPYARWREQLITRLAANSGHPWRSFLPLLEDRPDEPKRPDVRLGTSNAVRGLEGTGIRCRALNEELLKVYCDAYFAAGMLTRPSR